jgi:hypothetical protein
VLIVRMPAADRLPAAFAHGAARGYASHGYRAATRPDAVPAAGADAPADPADPGTGSASSARPDAPRRAGTTAGRLNPRTGHL